MMLFLFFISFLLFHVLLQDPVVLFQLFDIRRERERGFPSRAGFVRFGTQCCVRNVKASSKSL